MIELIDGYCLLLDDYCYALAKKKNSVDKRTGKEQFYYLGYYGKIELALLALSRRLAFDRLKDSHVDLAEAINVIHESNETVRKLLEAII